MKVLVVTLCTYEVLAIATGRVPTLTELNRRSPVVGPALVVGLAWHFHLARKIASVVDPGEV